MQHKSPFFEAARQYRDILLYVSPRLLAELADVLGREKLAIAVAASGQPPEALMQSYLQVARIVVPATIAPVIVADPDDDHVLACALAAQADLIVSGDPHLRNLKTYHGIPIITATDALRQIERA